MKTIKQGQVWVAIFLQSGNQVFSETYFLIYVYFYGGFYWDAFMEL